MTPSLVLQSLEEQRKYLSEEIQLMPSGSLLRQAAVDRLRQQDEQLERVRTELSRQAGKS